jgi:hypothetical protein
VDFAVDFSYDSSGEMEEFVQNGLKIFKNFRRSQQSTTWPIRDDLQQFTFFEKVDKLSTSQKEIPQQSIYCQKSTIDRLQCLLAVSNREGWDKKSNVTRKERLPPIVFRIE